MTDEFEKYNAITVPAYEPKSGSRLFAVSKFEKRISTRSISRWTLSDIIRAAANTIDTYLEDVRTSLGSRSILVNEKLLISQTSRKEYDF